MNIDFKETILIGQWIGIIITVVAIIGLIKIYKYKEENEKYLVLKMIGFYFLGAFSFNIPFIEEVYVYIYLPVGYLIFYSAMKNKDRCNKIVKNKCAMWGLIILCVSCVTNGISNYLEYRDMNFNFNGNVKNLSLEWQEIKEKCNIDSDVPLEGARILYNKDGKISDLIYFTIDHNKNKSYQITIDKQKYNVVVEKYSGETYDVNSYYDNTTDDFLEVLAHINKSDEKIMNYNVIIYENELYSENDVDDLYLVNKDNNEYKKVNENGLYGLVINYFANEVEDGSSGKSYTAKYVFEAK